MLRKVTLFLLAFVSTIVIAQAQYCGFDKQHQHLMATNPDYAQKVQQMNDDIASFVQNNVNSLVVNTTTGLAYEIPVVIHVMHTGGAIGSIYNPTDAQLIGMIDYLNKTYAANWASYPNSTNGGTYIPLRFALAKRDPNCQPTSGIIRVNGSSVSGYASDGIMHSGTVGADEATVKALSIWPGDRYYNIWIVNKIDSQDGTSGTFVAGYAYFPPAPSNVDGTIMLATMAIAGEITLPHEIGHAFTLYHTFEGDQTNPPALNCPTNTTCATQGDLVCDTDPEERSQFNCPTGTNPCTGNPFGTIVHNFMDYSNCQDRFTAGQKTRVMSGITTSRPSLISSTGGMDFPLVPMATACIPTSTNTTNAGNVGPRSIKISDATMTYMNLTTPGGYTLDGNMVFVDKSCQHEAYLKAGSAYSFAVKTGTNENVKLYIDFNNDGTFQATELAQSWTVGNFGTTKTFTYTIPTTATVPSLVSCQPLRMRIVADTSNATSTLANLNACGPLSLGQAEDYSVVIYGGGATTGTASVTLSSGTNPSCIGSTITFKGNAPMGATTPTFKWYVNSVFTGITDSMFTSSTLNNHDTVKIKTYYTGLCGTDSAWSTGYVVLRSNSIAPSVTIALVSGNNPGCPNQVLGFKATPTLGGTAPVYQWRINGVAAGTTADTFSSFFANNDIVTVKLTSNSSCAVPDSAISNSMLVTHSLMTAGVSINQVNGTNPSCANRTNGFELVNNNAGANPTYQWHLDTTAIVGATTTSYSNSSLVSYDSIWVVMTATDPCVANIHDTSGKIVMMINPNDTPQVTIAVTAGANPGCLDSLIQITPTVTHEGANPMPIWYVNGVQNSFTTLFSSTTLANLDTVQVYSIATDGGCYVSDTVVSAPLIMHLYSTPNPPIISFIGTILVSNVPNNIVWFGPNGIITGATSQTYTPTIPGHYYACINNNGCLSKPSNVLIISIMDIASYDMSKVKVYPNPTNGLVTLDWGSKSTTATLDIYNMNGQGLMHEKALNQTIKTIDISNFVDGLYFILVKDDEGKVGTIKVLLEK